MEVRKIGDIHSQFIEQQLNAANVTLEEAIEYTDRRQKEQHKVWAKRVSKQLQLSPRSSDREPKSIEQCLEESGRSCSQRKRTLLNKVLEEIRVQGNSEFGLIPMPETREIEREKRRAKAREYKSKRKRAKSKLAHAQREQKLGKYLRAEKDSGTAGQHREGEREQGD